MERVATTALILVPGKSKRVIIKRDRDSASLLDLSSLKSAV
jgi:hypothetical protein